MNKQNNIRNWLAGFLLLVFALSSTPKVLFHEVLAGHNDGLVCKDKDKSSPHLHQPSFHCAFDDLVVSSPYLSFEITEPAQPPVYAVLSSQSLILFSFSSPFFRLENRGPPFA